MTRATVTQIRAPRAATRLGPKEARTYVRRARAAGLITAPAARALFEHLLRVCDPRQGFSQSLPQANQLNQGASGTVTMTGLTVQLDVTPRTLRRANRALEASGLVRVESGIGRRWTRYTLNAAQITAVLGELPGSPWGNYPVHPGEKPHSETGQLDPSEGSERPLSPDELAGQRGQNPAPYTRARVHARESDRSKNSAPHPHQAPHGPLSDDSPPASGQGPLSDPTKCEHGRTTAQGGCRKCGTTVRADEQRRAAQARADEQAARRAEQLRQRADAEARRARAADPELIAQARAGLRAGKQPKGDPG